MLRRNTASLIKNFEFDFSLPLRSAIAARIYIESLLDENQNYPASLEEQAQFWATRYRRNSTQDPDTFVARVRDYEEDDDNRMKMWIIFLFFFSAKAAFF